MKKIILVLSILLVSAASMDAQVQSTFFQAKNAFQTYSALESISTAIPVKQMPAVNVESLLAEDQELEGLDVPFRFGYGFDVSYTLEDGEWEENGDINVWSLKITSPGAYSLNFIFDRLSLAYGAELYVYSVDGTMVYGPVTASENLPEAEASVSAVTDTLTLNESGKLFLTDLVAGDAVIIRLIEPANIPTPSVLRISRVVHGYVNTFSSLNENALMGTATLTCHNDVACYSTWQNESDAVAKVLLADGIRTCSGALVNNTSQNFMPYFLSAFHCVDINNDETASTAERSNAQNWVYTFRYKKTTCNGSTVASYFSYNGSTYLAGWSTTDFLLMQLNFYEKWTGNLHTYLGWDRTGTTPSSGTGIHHPNGDVMKISFRNQSFTKNSAAISWGNSGTTSAANTHWEVGLTSGAIEGGSSGSPLFNQDKRVIGQLHGGQVYCPPATSYYGAFDLSWTGGGTSDTRLSGWLDPTGTGATTTDIIRPTVPTYTVNFPSTLYINGNNPFSINWTYCPDNVRWEVFVRIVINGTPIWSYSGYATKNYPYGNISLLNDYPYYPDSYDNTCHVSLMFRCVLPASGQIISQTTTSYSALCPDCNFSIPCSADSLEIASFASEINSYPSPTSNILNVEIDADVYRTNGVASQSIFDIRLISPAGIQVLQTTGRSKETIPLNVSNIPNGIYLLQVYDREGVKHETRKIIIAH